MHRPGRLAFVVPTVALTALLAACGGSDQGKAAPTVSVGRSSSPTPTPTPTPTGPVELTTETFGTTVGAAMSGLASYDSVFASDDPDAPVTGTASIVATPGAEALGIVMDTGPDSGTFELRLVGGKTFLSIRKMTGEKFFAIDPNDPSSPFTADDLAGMREGLDAGRQINDLLPGITGVVRSGAAEALDGVQAQPYDLTIDPAKVSADVNDALFSDANGAVPAAITYRLWVDADDHVRKTSYTVGGVTTVTTYNHFGAGGAVVAPTADQLVSSPL